tara:strand:- start:83 stop:769 length:687 start_codon:yes stop_codon:yes gene_type:complete
MTLLPVFSPATAGGATIENTDDSFTTTSTLTPSFADQAMGTASSDRIIVATAAGYYSSLQTLGSYSIAGETGTERIASASGGGNRPGMFSAPVSSGTTGTMAPTWISQPACYDTSIGIWAIKGSGANPTDTGSVFVAGGSSTLLSVTVDVPAGGVVVAYTICYNVAGTPNSFVGVDQDFVTATTGTDGQTFHAGGSKAYAASQTDLDVTVANTGTPERSLIVAVWGPA